MTLKASVGQPKCSSVSTDIPRKLLNLGITQSFEGATEIRIRHEPNPPQQCAHRSVRGRAKGSKDRIVQPSGEEETGATVRTHVIAGQTAGHHPGRQQFLS